MSHDTELPMRKQILDVAGAMFLRYGYGGTTFQKIAGELGIVKSTITYHFKNKFMLMEELIDDFFEMLKSFVDSYPDEYRNKYWRHCVVYIYAYRRIMSCPRTMELFYHKDQQEQWMNHKIDVVSHVLEQVEQDFHKSYDMKDLRIKVRMDMGARINLYTYYQENPGAMTLDEYCYYHIYHIGVLCKLDELTIRENIRDAFAFADSHQPPAHCIFGRPAASFIKTSFPSPQ